MGFNDTEWAYSLDLKPTLSAVLAAVCHRTDDASHATIVGQQTIAYMLGFERVTVLRSLRALEQANIITRTTRNRRDGSKTSDTITVNVTESNIAQNNIARSHVAFSTGDEYSKQQQEEAKASPLDQPEGQPVVGRKRGARIPEPFIVTEAMVAWARERTPLVDGKRATEKFINHFTSATGRNATKLDWPATWRNWMLNDQERAEHTHQPGPRKLTNAELAMADYVNIYGEPDGLAANTPVAHSRQLGR